MTDRKQSERTAYPRLLAPVYFTRSGLPRWLPRQRAPAGDTLGGVSVFTDERPAEGVPLRLEVFLVDGTSVTCRVVVAWVDPLPDGAPARFEVGLEFTALRPGDRERLSVAIGSPQG
jgi:PilZ domain